MNSLFSGFNRPMNLQALLKANDISPQVQSHLSAVYTTLTAGIMMAAAGSYLELMFGFGGILTAIAAVGFMVWLMVDQQKNNIPRRLGIFAGFTFFKGASLNGLIRTALFIDPSIVVTALFGTIAIFGCFSLAATLSPRRKYLYLGGILSSVLGVMFMINLASMFFGGIGLMAQVYITLFVFIGYVVYDTQVIIEKATAGSTDFVLHAAELFIDFVAIFVRILIILMKNAGNKKKRSDRR